MKDFKWNEFVFKFQENQYYKNCKYMIGHQTKY